MSGGLLFDTCAVIFISTGLGIQPDVQSRIIELADTGETWVSPISAWELGKSMALGRLRSTLSPLEFYEEFAEGMGSGVCHLTARALVDSSFLPLLAHKDPMDRILIAIARANDLTLVTRDSAILDYGAAGHVKTLEC
jgi:PIN domain nuclease of toxin-antitoxin system